MLQRVPAQEDIRPTRLWLKHRIGDGHRSVGFLQRAHRAGDVLDPGGDFHGLDLDRFLAQGSTRVLAR
jgi:hypothetical protein